MRRRRLLLQPRLRCSRRRRRRAQREPNRVLAFWSTNVEGDHVQFAREALEFYQRAAATHGMQFDSTTNWDDLNARRLEGVGLVLWLNDFPHAASQREAFEGYMEKGGGWIGFHVSAYNDSGTHWPWFVNFLGGAVFYGNNWPPLPRGFGVDDPSHPVTRRLPKRLLSPDNEWYSWLPNPRANRDVKVLLTLESSNLPLGLKDTIAGGDVPVVWTNTKYRMIYFNMGHGDKIFSDSHQNGMFEGALLWLARRP
ncbi:MAG: ThuA domain-containing protein [Ignavibacteriota bacterium]